MTTNLLTAAGAKDCFKSLMDTMIINIKKDGFITPFFGIVATKNIDGVKMLSPHFFFLSPVQGMSDLNKDELANLVRRVAEKVGAVGIIFGSEAWARECSKEKAEENCSVVDSPDKFEVIMAMVEHRSLGRAAFQAKIVRDAIGTVVDVEEFKGEYVAEDNGDSGRFLGLLPEAIDFNHTMKGGEA